MFGRVLGHLTILFWGFGTKMNENDEKCKSRDWFASLLNFYVQKCKSSHHAKVEKKEKECPVMMPRNQVKQKKWHISKKNCHMCIESKLRA